MLVTSDSSDEQQKFLVGKEDSSPPAGESSYIEEDSLSRRGRRLAYHRKIEKQFHSDEAGNLADEVDEERM